MARREVYRRKMFSLIEEYLGSEESERAFCTRRRLTRGVFAYWRGKYFREGRASNAFVEIEPPAAASAASVEIAFPSGVRMTFFGPVDAMTLFVLATRQAA